MSRRTKLKLRNLKLFMAKYIFNGRFLVRNILVVTLLACVVATVYGVGYFVSDSRKDSTTDKREIVAEEVTIEIGKTAVIKKSSIGILVGSFDSNSVADVVAKDTEIVADATSEFDSKFVSTCDNVNIRDKASQSSEIIGKMEDGTVGDIISSDGEWLQVKSGDITGYVNSEFVKTGKDAYEYAKKFYHETATVNDDGVCIREEASKESEVVLSAFAGESFEIGKSNSDNSDWVCIVIDDSTVGYINSDFVDVTKGYPVATPYKDDTDDIDTNDIEKEDGTEVSFQTDKNEPDLTAKADDEVGDVANQPSPEADTTTADNSSNDDQNIDNQVAPSVTARGAITLSEDDINLIAAVMTLECGAEPYDGQLAVANVILNRLQSGAYGSTVSDVVYAPNQFTVVNSDRFQSVLNGGASSSCVNAIREACQGTNNIGSYISYRPVSNVDVSSFGSYVVIGNHCFY